MKDIINKHKGCPAIIVGHGPSLDDYVDKLQSYKEKGFKIFHCNDWYHFGEKPTEPNYWTFSSTVFTMKSHKSKIDQYNSTMLYQDTADWTPREWVEENIKCDYLPYDARHIDSKSLSKACNGKCCKYIIPGRLTIQEELQKYTNYKKHFGIMCGTMILFPISFAIIMGCNPVYITGMDLDYHIGYAKATYPVSIPSDDYFDHCRDSIINDLKIINDSAKNIGIKLINLNKKSIFDTIEIGDIRKEDGANKTKELDKPNKKPLEDVQK